MRKEDSGGTSPTRVYVVKKMKSPDLLLANDATPLFTLHVRLGACHPINRCRLAREPVILNCEGGSSAAMAVDGGRRLWRKTSAKDEGDGCKRQENGTMDPYSQFRPCLSSPASRGPSPAHRSALDSEMVVQRR
jgi:hypothetical protein